MDNQYNYFIIKTETSEHEPVLIIGVGSEDDPSFEQELRERFSSWRLPAEARTEPFLLDFYLAKELSRECPDHIMALGGTIKTALSHGCSGGVIGDPHMEPRSVNTYTEKLSGGLVLAGLPGGPGFVCLSTEEEAWTLLNSLGEFERRNGAELLERLAREAYAMNIPFWIGVADGSGYCEGAVGVQKAGEIKIVTLE